MHGAFHKSYELLASEMGHSANSSMLIKRYKNIVRGSVAAAFWNIYPSQQSAGSELTG